MLEYWYRDYKGEKMKKFHLSLALAATVSLIVLSGCATKAETGALVGAGTGALLGQAIGRNTGATIAGAAVGGLAGAAIGANEDKKDRERYYR